MCLLTGCRIIAELSDGIAIPASSLSHSPVICAEYKNVRTETTCNMYESGCAGYPVNCGHCGKNYSSGYFLLQHLNVGGLTKTIPPLNSVSVYSPVTLPSIITLSSVAPAVVSFCSSDVQSISSSIPASSVLQFSLTSASIPSSLPSGTEHSTVSICNTPVTHSSTSSPQNSSPASLTSCLSPGFLLTGFSPNPLYQWSPSSFLCSSPVTSSHVTSSPVISTSMSTPPICSVSMSQSFPVSSARQGDGASLEAGTTSLFRADRSEDYAYLFFLHHIVNSSFCTAELQRLYESLEASFRSFLVAENYPQALEASVGDLLTHFVPLINLVGEKDRQLPSS